MLQKCIGILFFIMSLTLSIEGCASESPETEIYVAAASSMRLAGDSLASKFRENENINVVMTYGSSGKLTNQILSGAPFDIFLSADTIGPLKLQSQGLTKSELKIYAKGRVMLYFDPNSIHPTDFQDLANQPLKHLSISDPALAPYGLAAIRALENAGIYNQLQDRIVNAQNVSQVLQHVLTGASDAGISSLTFRNKAEGEGLNTIEIPVELYDFPMHSGVLLSEKTAARKFLEFIAEQEGQNILEHFGFESGGLHVH